MRPIWILIVGATLANGILAGGDVDRWIVGMPAWQSVGIVGWADYSRVADLGNGIVLYPVLAIGGTLLSLAAALSFMRQPRGERFAIIPLGAAAVLAIAGLLITLKAAPFMLSLRHTGDEDIVSLQRAFDQFKLWGGIRAVLQALGFVANLWSLVAIAKCRQAK